MSHFAAPAVASPLLSLPASVRPKMPTGSTDATAAVHTKSNGHAAPKSRSVSPLCILYGSATGNAEHIAKGLASKYEALLKSTPCYFTSVICCELDQYKAKCQKHWNVPPVPSNTKHGVIVVASTTGNADAPENASRFFRYIKRKSTVDSLPFQHVCYAVLGLGDTNYDQFCAVGKMIDKKLGELGGVRGKPLGCADEATGLEDVVDPWIETALEEVTKACSGGWLNPRGTSEAERDLPSTALLPTMDPSERPGNETSTERDNLLKVDNSVTLLVAEPETGDKRSDVTNGVSIIRKLLSLSSTEAFPIVSHSSLPSLGSSVSSCELVHHDADLISPRRLRGYSLSETVSSGSTSNIHYTVSHPFESAILGARYLTNTDVTGAKLACSALTLGENDGNATADERLMRAMACFEEQFPLCPLKKSERSSSTKEEEAVYERHGKRVIEMTLALPDDYTIEYKPGDSIGLVVSNTPQATLFVLSMLNERQNIAPTQKISVDTGHPITVAEAIRHNVDLCTPIKNKRILVSLSQFASDPDEECALRLLASNTTQGEEMFEKFINQQRRNVVDILRDFPSCQNITLDALLGNLPGIAPRYYSVSSSPLAKKKHTLSLTVAFSVVDHLTPPIMPGVNERRRIGGLATRYLETICSPFLCNSNDEIKDGNNKPSFTTIGVKPTTIKVFPKPTSEFHLPQNFSTPLILIGPGTGIAPFMGFLAHRKAQVQSQDITQAARGASEGTWRGGYDIQEDELHVTRSDAKGLVIGADYRSKLNVGEIDVYFGCRYRDHDWLYHEEMRALEEEGVITKLHTAFSREDEERRTYVQDLMKNDKECADRLARMIMDENAMVYVCGDGNAMGRDVQDAIVTVMARYRFIDTNHDSKEEVSDEAATTKARAYLEEMKAKQRFVLDIWS